LIDQGLCDKKPELRKGSRKSRIYFVLEKLKEHDVIYVDCTARLTRFRPTPDWVKIIVEENQLQDEIEEMEQPIDVAPAIIELYRAELAEMDDEAIAERVNCMAITYRGLKQGILEYIGGKRARKRFRMTRRALKLVNRVGLKTAIAHFEANLTQIALDEDVSEVRS
jgi:hypothetical protein